MPKKWDNAINELQSKLRSPRRMHTGKSPKLVWDKPVGESWRGGMSDQLKPNMYVEVESWGWRGYPPEREWSITVVGSREFCQKVAAYVESLQSKDNAGRMGRLFRACEEQLPHENE